MDELLFFDLDGTLLDTNERLSINTRYALNQLDRLGISWTIATGRMPHSVFSALPELDFKLPQVYKNGVLIWDAQANRFSHKVPMKHASALSICSRLQQLNIQPWLNTLDCEGNITAIIQSISNDSDDQWATMLSKQGVAIQTDIQWNAITDDIINIFSTTPNKDVTTLAKQLHDIKDATVYVGHDMYGGTDYWLDIHHLAGTKGEAMSILKKQMNAKHIICFGDSDNDISMFECADECYAMGQGLETLKHMATDILDTNANDGIAKFLATRYQFTLPN